jgi:hypothetical protein
MFCRPRIRLQLITNRVCCYESMHTFGDDLQAPVDCVLLLADFDCFLELNFPNEFLRGIQLPFHGRVSRLECNDPLQVSNSELRLKDL